MREPQVPIRLDDVPHLVPFEEDLRVLGVRDVRAVRHEDGAWSAHIAFGQYWSRTRRTRGADVATLERNAMVWMLNPRPDRESALAAAGVLLRAIVSGRHEAIEQFPPARESLPDDAKLTGMVLDDWLRAHDGRRRRRRWWRPTGI